MAIGGGYEVVAIGIVAIWGGGHRGGGYGVVTIGGWLQGVVVIRGGGHRRQWWL